MKNICIQFLSASNIVDVLFTILFKVKVILFNPIAFCFSNTHYPPPVYTLCFRWSFSVHTHTYTHTHCKSLQQMSSVGFSPCLWRMTMWDFLDLLSCFLLQCCSSFHYTIICARIPVTSTQFRSTFQSICLCLCSMDFFSFFLLPPTGLLYRIIFFFFCLFESIVICLADCQCWDWFSLLWQAVCLTLCAV